MSSHYGRESVYADIYWCILICTDIVLIERVCHDILIERVCMLMHTGREGLHADKY